MKIVILIALTVGALFTDQAVQTEPAVARYVALGSSYAAGIGLGEPIEGDPKLCMRGTGSYPRILAQQIGAELVDASCSGSTAGQVLSERQGGLPPQINAVTSDTDLVTITVGGNDLDYAGDMMRAAGWFGGLKAPLRSAKSRPYAQLRENIIAILSEVRRRAPHARIVLATYPDVLPQRGNCDSLGFDAGQADIFREIADRLAKTSRSAAAAVKGTILVDMARISEGHDACSSEPWTTGAHPAKGFAYHPTQSGAEAVAENIRLALQSGKP